MDPVKSGGVEMTTWITSPLNSRLKVRENVRVHHGTGGSRGIGYDGIRHASVKFSDIRIS